MVPVPQALADATRDGCPAGAHTASLTAQCLWSPGGPQASPETLQARAVLSQLPWGSRTPTSSARARPSPLAETWLITFLLAPLLGLLGPWLDTRAGLPGSHPGESVDGASDLSAPCYMLQVLLGAQAPGGTGSSHLIPTWPSPRLGLARVSPRCSTLQWYINGIPG